MIFHYSQRCRRSVVTVEITFRLIRVKVDLETQTTYTYILSIKKFSDQLSNGSHNYLATKSIFLTNDQLFFSRYII